MSSKTSTSGSSGTDSGSESVVMDVGRHISNCGYCRSGGRTSISHGLWANSLTVDHYQALLDRGWRRSGCFLYKPEMDRTCCPSYTIRLKASDFNPSKEQLRLSKKIQRFLDGTLDIRKADNVINEPSTTGGPDNDSLNFPTNSVVIHSSVVDSKNNGKTDQVLKSLSDQIDQMVQLCMENADLPSDIQWPKASVKKVTPAKKKLQAEVSESLLYTCNIAFQIAAMLRQKKKNVEPAVSGNNDLVEISAEKIAEILAIYLQNCPEPHGLSIRACNGHINFYSATERGCLVEETGECTGKKPFTVENRGVEKRLVKRQSIQCQRQRFEIRLKQSCFDNEEYALYRKYQMQVHNDTPDRVTESSYRMFLVDSPLIHISPSDDVAAPSCGFGSFHQQYLVDGKLIAVGVIDILPKCLSSKYLFWDPDLAFLSLGKFSALEEIRWVKENQVHCPSLQYYYLGYYIHSCNKMRYKAAYRPSMLLCPLRYLWVPYDTAKRLLDRNKYVALSDFTALQNGDLVPLDVTDNNMEEQNDSIQESTNDVFMNDDEMSENEYEDSDNVSDSEANGATFTETEDADLSNILIGLERTRLRFKDIRHAFDSTQRKLFESRLQKYTKVVGTELSEQIIYSIA